MGSREEDITFMNGSSILLSLHTHTHTHTHTRASNILEGSIKCLYSALYMQDTQGLTLC